MPRFEYLDDLAPLDPATIVVRVPASIRSKEKLFSIYARRLAFPAYFGDNWDAFEECLGDRSWLDGARPIVIVHADVPFREGGPQRAIYLLVLRDLNGSMDAPGTGSLRIVFPRAVEAAVSSALA